MLNNEPNRVDSFNYRDLWVAVNGGLKADIKYKVEAGRKENFSLILAIENSSRNDWR